MPMQTIDAIKVVKNDDDETRISGQGVRFGNVNEADLDSEYFNSETEFYLSDVKMSRAQDEEWSPTSLKMLYHHGLDPAMNGSDALIGSFDKVRMTDAGLWFEGQLDKANRYKDKILELIEEGALYMSSDSVGHLKRKVREQADGGKTVYRISEWPLFGVSLTTTPAEPRLMEVEAAKSYNGDLFTRLDGEAAKREDLRRRQAQAQIDILRIKWQSV